MLKAIETKYKGYRFRSRLEARWAVFFDALGVPWEYEQEGYSLNGAGRYLPDFWLPIHKSYIEIKGDQLHLNQLGKQNALCQESERPVAVFCGNHFADFDSPLYATFRLMWHGTFVDTDSYWGWAWCADFAYMVNQLRENSDLEFFHPRIVQARKAALSARFEHGEHP